MASKVKQCRWFWGVSRALAIVLIVLLLVGCVGTTGKEVSDDWFVRVNENVTDLDQPFTQISSDRWLANNQIQRLRTSLSPVGLHISSTDPSAPDWGLAMHLSKFGREGNTSAVIEATPTVEGAWVVFRRKALSEWYANTQKGFRTGVVIEEPPNRGALSSPLLLELKVDTNLMPRATPGSQAVEFLAQGNVPVLRYHRLSVIDATGKNLSTQISLQQDQIQIRIADQGAVYPLMLGGSLSSVNESSTPELQLLEGNVFRIDGNQSEAHFGHSVATAGDVNGDGYSDIIVGVPYFENGQTNEGAVFVYLGSATGLVTSSPWTVESDRRGERLGSSVATAGDVNGDGYSDVIVGAPSATTSYPFIAGGRAYVYLGSATGLATSPAWTVEGEAEYAYFGQSVAPAGDVNGDGYSDIIVGAPYLTRSSGKTFVYLGSATGLATSPAWTVSDDHEIGIKGYSVATAGDVNGDGYSDVIVGASCQDFNNIALREQVISVYLGAATGLATSPAWTVEFDCYGHSAATAGDVNGDGYSDVIVGLPDSNYIGDTDGGVVFAYFGSATGLATSPAWSVESDRERAAMGYSVATAGDVNGDGYSDVVLGAPGTPYSQDEGQASVYLGSATGLAPSPAWSVESGQDGAKLGYSVATAGDVDGDGYGDVIIGAPELDDGEINEGRVIVYLSSAYATPPHPSWSTESVQVGAWLGYSVASAGDVNGDSYSDVIIGIPRYDNGEVQGGKIIVYLGTAHGLSSAPHWVAEGHEHGARFGFSVATAGDVNGDGFSDIIIGAPGAKPGGKAYVWFGGETGLIGPGTEYNAEWIGENTQIQAYFGHSVASAGDVNGDGFGDIIIGAPLYDDAQVDEGNVFLYLGSPSGLSSSPNWSAGGDQPGAHFGWSVAGALDFNADGYSDIAIGSPLYDSERTDSGAVFVWHGGKVSDNYGGSGLGENGTRSNADWFKAGPIQENAQYGFSVSSAGDLNADGYSDVVIGAPYVDGSETNEGAVYAYLGTSSGLSNAHVFYVTSRQLEAKLGWSVANVGNYNDSGFSAVLAGAPFYDSFARNAGEVFIIPGSETVTVPTRLPSLNRPSLGANYIDPITQFGFSVSAAGDVNSDGYSDIMVGAPFYDSRYAVPGQTFAFYGGPSNFAFEKNLRQLNMDNWGLIGPLGKSDGETAFRISMLGRSAGGRARVRLEWEVKPVGTPFNGTGRQQASQELDTGAPRDAGSVTTLEGTVSQLTPGEHYHWRARVLTDSPFFPHSRWFTLPFNSPTEKKLRTAGDTNHPPRASFTAAPTSGLAPLQVTFDASASSDPDGTIVGYDWNFGDGAMGTGATTTHTYTAIGTFVVNLTVTDNDGSINRASNVFITVTGQNQPPLASFEANPTAGVAPCTVTFDASSSTDSDGNITEFAWNFGDGGESTGMSPTHTFTTGSMYVVTLAVTDDKGATTTARKSVTVLPSTAIPLTLTKLTGLTGSEPAHTAIYRADLSGIGLSTIEAITIIDHSAGAGGSGGKFSGLDLDGIKLSTTLCSDAACAKGLTGLSLFDFSPGKTLFTPGLQRPPEAQRLFGTDDTGSRIDDTIARLGLFDGLSLVHGFLCMGDGGILTFNLTDSVSTNGLFLYIGEINDTGEITRAEFIVSASPLPVETDPIGIVAAAKSAIRRGETEIDLNGDGYKEYRKIIDSSGTLSREEIDINGDGSPELIWDFAGATKTYSIDLNSDGVLEKRREVIPDPADPSIHTVIITKDTTGDGIPDYRISYTLEPSSDIVVIWHEEDADQDGNYTLLGTSTTTKLQNDIVWDPLKPCNHSQKQQINDAYERAIVEGLACLYQLDDTLFYEFLHLVTANDFRFECGACDPSGAACVPSDAIDDYWRGELSELPIRVAQFGGGDLAGVIFHEMLHYIHGGHLFGDGKDDPGDQTYGCEETCFGSANSKTCAACLGTYNGDPRCDNLPQEPCTGELVPAYCYNDGKIYETITHCAVQCPTLPEPMARCQELGPCR